MKKFILVVSICASMMLSGCLSDYLSPREDPTKFYILDVKPQVLKNSYKGDVLLRPMMLPGYLNRSQITSLGEGSMVEISEFNRWAEAPESLFSRTFAKCFEKNLPNASIYSYPESPAVITGNVREIRIAISECIGKVGGDFIFAGRALIISGNKTKVVNFEKKISAGKGYSGYVSAISTCITDVAQDISKTIIEGK